MDPDSLRVYSALVVLRAAKAPDLAYATRRALHRVIDCAKKLEDLGYVNMREDSVNLTEAGELASEMRAGCRPWLLAIQPAKPKDLVEAGFVEVAREAYIAPFSKPLLEYSLNVECELLGVTTCKKLSRRWMEEVAYVTPLRALEVAKDRLKKSIEALRRANPPSMRYATVTMKSAMMKLHEAKYIAANARYPKRQRSALGTLMPDLKQANVREQLLRLIVRASEEVQEVEHAITLRALSGFNNAGYSI